jgi:hypothetical protein
VCVDFLATGRGNITDDGDPIAVDRDVGASRRGSRSVDHRSTADDEIVHGRRIRGICSRR